MSPPLPWQTEQWRGVLTRLRQHNLPHALLVAGPAGVGKFDFARRLAQTILCTQPSEAGPCGACPGCGLYAAGTHPDVHVVTPAEEGKAIVVDQIRDVLDYVALKPHYAPFKVTLVCPAERMNSNAANSLLKTLEEPPAQSLVVLVSHRPDGLLPTIRSRCQVITMPRPAQGPALAWLKERGAGAAAEALLALAQGAPLASLALAGTDTLARRDAVVAGLERLGTDDDDMLGEAARWLNMGAKEPLMWLTGCVMDMLRLAVTEVPPQLYHPDQAERLRRLGATLEPARLHRFLDRVHNALRLVDTSLNTQLLVESVLLEWHRLRHAA